MHWQERFEDWAERNHGLVGKIHLPRLEATSVEWWRAVRSPSWELVGARVLRRRGAPVTDEQRCLAAVLDASPGAVLHGPTTLAWFDFGGFRLGKLRVARARNRNRIQTELAHVHELRALRAHHVMVFRGVPTETPLRAIWGEAARLSTPRLHEVGVDRVGRLLDDAHRRGLVTWAALHEMVDDIRERGRAGTTIMRELASERLPGTSLTETRNEDQFEKILADAGVRQLRRQVVVGGHGTIGRADFRDDEVPLVVEVNSLTFHTTPSDRRDDEIRYQRMNDAGFTVAVIWEDDLWSRRSAVVDTLERARRLAGGGEHSVLHSPGCPWPSASGTPDVS